MERTSVTPNVKSKHEFYDCLDRLLQELGFPEKKKKLLKALIEIKSGTPSEIARRAGLSGGAPDIYNYLHEIGCIEGVVEVKSPKMKKQFFRYYVENTQKIVEGLFDLLEDKYSKLKEECEKKMKELNAMRSKTVELYKDLFKESTGVDFTIKSPTSSLLESAEGVINAVDSLILGSVNRVYFIAGSGKRMKREILAKSKARDIKIILDQKTVSKGSIENLNILKDKLDFKVIDSPFPSIRILIADNQALIFKWGRSEKIEWGLLLRDKEDVNLYLTIFHTLWNKGGI
ncbi:MAG: hypothetical protein QXG39_01460 [Candidatus Aenigmatarchaeota archaeon]